MPRLDAARADHDALGTPFLQCPHGLQIGVETPFIDVVGMADMIAHHGFLATDFTFPGHLVSLSMIPIGG